MELHRTGAVDPQEDCPGVREGTQGGGIPSGEGNLLRTKGIIFYFRYSLTEGSWCIVFVKAPLNRSLSSPWRGRHVVWPSGDIYRTQTEKAGSISLQYLLPGDKSDDADSAS